MASSKIEFAVQMTCESCVRAVKQKLEGVKEVEDFTIDLNTGSVVVKTSLPSDAILKTLESTGKKVVIRGLGNSIAGVVILEAGSENIKGVIRLMQENSNTCIVDGTIDGLTPGQAHKLSVHECGDISNGCESVGNFYRSSTNGEYSNLGDVTAKNDGRAVFRLNSNMKLSEIIGRSMVISKSTGDNLACGIIARSAGLFENPKTICACDGVTIWNEEVKPSAQIS